MNDLNPWEEKVTEGVGCVVGWEILLDVGKQPVSGITRAERGFTSFRAIEPLVEVGEA